MHYVLDENNNRVEAYDKEEVLAALNKAIADGSLNNLVADAAFISKVKCCVSGVTHYFAFVTQAKYNELNASGGIKEDCYYFITDDTTADDINAKLNELLEWSTAVREGVRQVPNAIYANYADALNNTTHRIFCEGVKSYQILNKGVYLVRLCNDLNSSTTNCDFYTDIIWIEFPTAAVETFGLLRNSSGAHVLKYNHETNYLTVNAELGGVSTTILYLHKIL